MNGAGRKCPVRARSSSCLQGKEASARCFRGGLAQEKGAGGCVVFVAKGVDPGGRRDLRSLLVLVLVLVLVRVLVLVLVLVVVLVLVLWLCFCQVSWRKVEGCLGVAWTLEQ